MAQGVKTPIFYEKRQNGNEIFTISIAFLVWEIFESQGVKTPIFLMKNVNMKISYFNKYFHFDRYIMIIFIVITFFALEKLSD